ncbi:MAG TPA: TetR/AcrR family transcriptional regulator [Solirubrobacterales bacterium]
MAPQQEEGEAGGGPELGPLPGGHHGLSREQVKESQRERLLVATVADVSARGYRGATITEIVKLASVSTRDFYELFESKEEAFLTAFEAVIDHLKDLISEAIGKHSDDWPQQVVAALRTGLDFFAEEPELARFCLLEPVTATPKIAIRFREAVLEGVPGLEVGRAELETDAPLPASTEDSLIGGVVALAGRSVLTGDPAGLPEVLPDVVEFVLSPYLGPERAQELAGGV